MTVETSPILEYQQKQIIEVTQQVSEKAWNILRDVSAYLKPGISEGQIREKVLEIYKTHGVEKSWHRPYIYFGTNTVLTFMDKPQEEKILQEEDIAYIDLGPVVGEVEGDVGQTFVFGKNQLFQDLKHQTEKIFELARTYWLKKNPTGIELYEYIYKLTEEAGYIFHLEPAGHLIGSFPHKGWKNGLNTYPYPVEPGLWILEVQLRDPNQPYGAFYESVLI